MLKINNTLEAGKKKRITNYENIIVVANKPG